MNKNIRIALIFSILVLTIVVIPVSYSLVKDKNQESIVIHTLNVEYQGGMSLVSGVISNKIDSDINVKGFTLILKNSKQEVLFEEVLYIGEVLKSGESKPIVVQVSEDMSSIVDASFKLEVNNYEK